MNSKIDKVASLKLITKGPIFQTDGILSIYRLGRGWGVIGNGWYIYTHFRWIANRILCILNEKDDEKE